MNHKHVTDRSSATKQSPSVRNRTRTRASRTVRLRAEQIRTRHLRRRVASDKAGIRSEPLKQAVVAALVVAVFLIASVPAIRAFATPPDTAPAPLPPSFSVLIETGAGVHPGMVAERTARWNGPKAFSATLDLTYPGWDFRTPTEAASVVVAAPKSLGNWICVPVFQAIADSGDRSTTGVMWDQSVTLSQGTALSSTAREHFEDAFFHKAQKVDTSARWTADAVRHRLKSSPELGGESGTAQLIGANCLELRSAATLPHGLSAADSAAWVKTHAALVNPPLDDGSLRRVQFPDVMVTNSAHVIARTAFTFSFPINWTLVDGDLGGLILEPTRITTCTSAPNCVGSYNGDGFSWVFEDASARKKADAELGFSSAMFGTAVALGTSVLVTLCVAFWPRRSRWKNVLTRFRRHRRSPRM